MRIDGKVVLITGASEGIGAACAAEFARAGARLSLTARSEEGLRRAGGPRRADHGRRPDQRRDARAAVVERTLERFGAIDILINNAGMGFYVPSWGAPMEEARRLMELNFFALLGMIAACDAAHARAAERHHRQCGLDRRQDHAALADALQRLQIRRGRADRRPAHGVAPRRHPHHAGVPGLRARPVSSERHARAGAPDRDGARAGVSPSPPERVRRATSAAAWSAMRAR